MGLRTRIARLVGGRSYEKERKEISELLLEAYSRGIPIQSPESMLKQLGEVDPEYLDFLIRNMLQYTPVGNDNNEGARTQMITESRTMYRNDVLTGHIVDLWTDFGFGLEINIIPRDENAGELWQEFWTSPRNAPVLNTRKIHQNSINLLSDGEVFFAFFISTLDGTVTIRTIPSDQMVERITDPDDDNVVLYWKRQYTRKAGGSPTTIYYADWTAGDDDLSRAELPEDAVKADSLRDKTKVCVLPVLFKENKGRGWPLMSAAFSWSRVYRDFLQDRAAVAKAVASVVDKIKVKGGQRAVDAFRRQLESTLATSDSGMETNPPPVAGSRFIQNESVDLERMSLSTGAIDADKDGAGILAQVGLGGRLFNHWLGRGEAYRLATATSMEGPVLKAFQRYQNFWGSVWSDIVKIVLMSAERYGRAGMFETYEADINSDAILKTDLVVLNDVITSINDLFNNGLITLPVAGSAADQLVRVALGTLGIKNLDEVIGTARKFDDPSFEEPGFDPNDPYGGQIPPDDLLPDALPQMQGELSEALGITDYQKSVRALVYGLWSDNIDHFQFVDGMVGAISRYMSVGWLAGLQEEGVRFDEMSEKELASLEKLINDQFPYILDFAEAIEAGSRANGGALSPMIDRAGLWTNRYNEARNTALVMATSDPKLKWVSEKQQCSTCKGLHGKVKRASYWDAMGIKPQSPPNAMLECGGWQCGCHFERVPEEPLSKGYLPGTRNR
jgi:hypothetical protein